MYQVNREDCLSAFSVYQAKCLSYPIVSCVNLVLSCVYSIVSCVNPILCYLVKDNVAGIVV